MNTVNYDIFSKSVKGYAPANSNNVLNQCVNTKIYCTVLVGWLVSDGNTIILNDYYLAYYLCGIFQVFM